MSQIYSFFEIIFYKLNQLSLKGQNNANNAHFAVLNLTLLVDFNIVSLMIFIDKLKLVSLSIKSSYPIVALVLFTYLIFYILFLRKEKLKLIIKKYSGSNLARQSMMSKYLIIYIILTFLVLVVTLIL
jgi:hypothetical protein